jgi:predicted amidophosphoribosyltransferase
MADFDAVPRPHRPTPAPADLPPLVVVAEYTGAVRSVITAWKEHGVRSLAPVLAGVLADAVVHLVEVSGPRTARDLSIVAIPGSRASRRRRGENAWERVVRLAVGDLAERGILVSHQPCLALRRQPRDQAGLGADERWRNLTGAMECAAPPTGHVLLVDDIVTTGATLAEAARCLSQAGAPAGMALALAGTRRIGADRMQWH